MVHGVRRTGCSLRFRSAERSGLEGGASILSMSQPPRNRKKDSFDKFLL